MNERESEWVLSIHYVRQVADQLAAMGVDAGDWLAEHGLSEDSLDDADFTVCWEAFRQLFLDAVAITGEPSLGLLVGERLRVNTHGVLGYAAMNSRSVRQVVELVERFIPLRITLVSVRHQVETPFLQLRIEENVPLGEVRHLLIEAVAVAIKNILDFITLGACEIAEVRFAFPPESDERLAQAVFRCPVRYGQAWTGFLLPLSVVDKPLKTADPAAFEHAQALCERELARTLTDLSMAARLRKLLLSNQPCFPSLSVTARIFHMTPRTLHRKLVKEGTSFQKVLDEVRHTLAMEYLKSDGISIQELAYTLGYHDTANFRRAFKRWTGVAPSQFRL